jgi:DNA modification methylase
MKFNVILHGDSFDLIKEVPDECVDLQITSPPYFNQRVYSTDKREIGLEAKSDLYLSKIIELFKECMRVVKPTGSLIWNMGDKYISGSLQLIPYKFAIAAAQSGAILINNITWEKSNPTPRQFSRRMVSATEPFFHFVKTKNYKYYPERLLSHKIEAKSNSNAGNKYFGQIDSSELSLKEKNNARRDLSAAIEEIKSGKICGIRMKIRGIHSLPFGGQEGGRLNQIKNNGYSIIRIKGRSMLKDVIRCPVECIRGGQHSAVYPQDIVERFINLTTDGEDLVLDPFMGSGTTGCAAIATNRKYLGFDINQSFVKLSEERIKKTRVNQ